MVIKFDVGEEVLVKCTILKAYREEVLNEGIKTRYVIHIPGIVSKGIAEEDDLFEIPKPDDACTKIRRKDKNGSSKH